jgi:hypothetical protein
MKTPKSILAPAAALACMAGLAHAQFINEIRIDQPGSDNDEYVEIGGIAAFSLDGLSYIVIGDGAAALGSGVVESVTTFGPTDVIPASGFFIVSETTYTLSTPDLTVGTTGLNFENGDNVTHMLVSGWTGSNGADLDTDDDGTLDITPWTSIVDSVALLQSVTSGELVYSANTVGPDGTFVAGHADRCGEGRVGNFDPIGGDDTPGVANNCGPDTFCAGINALCPCGNGGLNGAGCDNPQATGGVLLSVSNFLPDGLGGGTAQFDSTGYNPAAGPTIVLIRSSMSSQPSTFGDGLLCLAAPVDRIQAGTALSGTASQSITHGAGAGSFAYQVWYRSLPMNFCTVDPFNTSSGILIGW